MSAQLLEAARNARATSTHAGEMFARAVFPAPEALLPALLNSTQAQVHWINCPEGGRMSGTLFTDGSGLHPRWPQLRRAGWAVVQVDASGQLVAAAYGPVPHDEAPEQIARDGEDYAVFMCSLVATPPFRLHIDCAGTLACVQLGKAYAAGADNARAHLWTKFWAQFEGEEVSATKTLAHATDNDIEQGKSTHWERAANGHADRLAKLGAADHVLPQETVDSFLGLAQLVKEAARWAGEHEEWLGELGHRDAGSIVDPPLQAMPCPSQLQQPSQRHMIQHNHKLVAADRLSGPSGSVIFCMRCGGRAVQRKGLLRRSCRGVPEQGNRATQRQQLLSGMCPGAQPQRLSQPRPLTAEEEAWLAGPRKAQRKAQLGCTGGRPGPFLQPQQLLQAFGLAEADLGAWARRASREARAQGAHNSPWGDGSSADEDGFEH